MTDRMNRLSLLASFVVGIAASVAIPALSASASASKHEPQAPQAEARKPQATGQQSAGEKKFNQNCARCHKAPQGFPPSITGTVLKHMRVRASLSEQDERDILSFLNP